MGIEYYAFALFIAGLVCLIMVLCRALFGSVKRKNALLDEKESKLLLLFRTVEDLMDEFNNEAEAKLEELREHERRAKARAEEEIAAPEIVRTESPVRGPESRETVDTSRIRAAGEALARAELLTKSDVKRKPETPVKAEGGAVFKRIIDELVDEPISLESDPALAQAPKNGRNETILELKAAGKTVAQIAQELGITQNEVKLVIGLIDRK